MSYNIFYKSLVFFVLLLFFCSAFNPQNNVISKSFSEDVIDPIKTIEDIDEKKVNFYVFDKKGNSAYEITLSSEEFEQFYNMFKDLNNKLTYQPFSSETKDLKSDFVDLLKDKDLIPNQLNKEEISRLINPTFEYKRRPLISLILNPVMEGRGYAFFCNYATFGEGSQFPVLIFPRLIPIIQLPIPRVFMRWSAIYGITSCGGLLSGKGFIAEGAQQGFALGFWGIGFSVFLPPVMSFGFIGYAFFSTATAENIIPWPPNRPPVILGEDPPDGTIDVPLSISELSFSLTDYDGDRMNYTVTTNPYIGSDSEQNVKDGKFSIDITGLESNTEYSWTIAVSDGEDTTEETNTFKTELEAPIVSDPSPVDEDSWVPVDISELSIRLEDLQGDPMDYSIETVPNIGSNSGSGVGNGVYSVPLDGLDFTKEYTWFVNVTDGKYWVRKTFSFKTQPIMEFNPFDENWSYCKKITIDHSQVAGDISEFPVLISMVDSDLASKAQSDGDDILFMDDFDFSNRLVHEIELFDDSNGKLISWVKVPIVSDIEDTILYLYYGNSGCGSQEYIDRVWDSNFIAIYHMDGSDYISIDDSTINNLDVIGKQGNLIFKESGKIGYCVDFDEACLNVDDNDLLSFTDGSNNDKPFTIEIWVKHDSEGGSNDGIISKYANKKREWLLRKYVDDKCDLRLCDDSIGVANWRETSTKINVNNVGWNYISTTYSGSKSGDSIHINLDGANNDGEAKTGGYNGMENLDEKMRIGAHHSHQNGWSYWQGLIDEVRISNIARSDDWLFTSYNTMNDPSNFITIGPEQSAP
jgi:hypothetical protein